MTWRLGGIIAGAAIFAVLTVPVTILVGLPAQGIGAEAVAEGNVLIGAILVAAAALLVRPPTRPVAVGFFGALLVASAAAGGLWGRVWWQPVDRLVGRATAPLRLKIRGARQMRAWTAAFRERSLDVDAAIGRMLELQSGCIREALARHSAGGVSTAEAVTAPEDCQHFRRDALEIAQAWPQRRTRRVDEAILGVYLSGANSRRIRSALAPLLQDGPLSKDAVSRLVGRLKDEFEQWRSRDLASEQVRYLFLDGWYPKVRLGKKRVVVPVLVVLGVRGDGRKVLLDLRLAGDESTAAWRDTIRSLVDRHVGTPALAVIDGSPGLRAALREAWPTVPVQRCTAHELRNLEAKAPKRQREELVEDYRRMIPPADQDASESPEPGRRVVVAVRTAPQRADPVAGNRWVAGDAGGEGGRVRAFPIG